MIHRFWIGPISPEHNWITETVQSSHSNVKNWTWDNLPDELTRTLNSGDNPRHLSNVIRYWLLFKYGGLWLDHDVIPFRDLTGSYNPWTASLRGKREGCVMWFPQPNHPMLTNLIRTALVKSKLEPSDKSGAKLLERIGLNYPDVGLEERVIPIDALGRQTGINEVWAVHLWNASSRTKKVEFWRNQAKTY